MKVLRDFLTDGTQLTRSGNVIGIEIETQFAMESGDPITTDVTDRLLALKVGGCTVKLELGRQNIELSIEPEANFNRVYDKARRCLDGLYQVARSLSCHAKFEPAPFAPWPDPLLYVQEERDQIWVDLDGEAALENLCRCSSVQFVIDVNPTDAIGWVNRLWEAKLHEVDYQINDLLWKAYIDKSHFGYRRDRYAGPEGFDDLDDYVTRLAEHDIVMHSGHPCRKNIARVPDLNPDLFLRSIWWHYRLRRYGSAMALEVRPMSRRCDEDIRTKWTLVADILGI